MVVDMEFLPRNCKPFGIHAPLVQTVFVPGFNEMITPGTLLRRVVMTP